MIMFFRLSIFLLITFLTVSCAERIQSLYVPTGITIPKALHTASLVDISNAIIEGGTLAGWKMKAVSPGKVHGTLNVRTHQADVDVNFTATEYSIVYVSSKNLLSQGARIHKAYNQWVRELETGINTGLDETTAEYKPVPPQKSIPDNEITLWLSVKDSKDPKELLGFLEKYGTGQYAPAAIAQLNFLHSKNRDSTKIEFDPRGTWDVTASYTGGLSNTSWCSKNTDWNFSLILSTGKISETIYSGRSPLFVSGYFDDEELDLKFTVPAGGSHWKWTEKFKLNRNEKRFTAISEAGAGSGCVGTIDVFMKKRNSSPQNSAARISPALSNSIFNPVGNWNVSVTYTPDAAKESCLQASDWKFVMNIRKGRFSKTVYDNRRQLYVNGELDDDELDLRFDVIYGGEQWKWTEPFKLDRPNKSFSLVAQAMSSAGCLGTLDIVMQKISR